MSHFTVKGNEQRCCAVEGCGWCDNGRHYGVYVKVGGKVEHRCPEHGQEIVEQRRKRDTDKERIRKRKRRGLFKSANRL